MANEMFIFLACSIYSILTEYSLHSCTFSGVLWPMGLWSEITARTLPFRGPTADVTLRWRNAFLHATSGRQTLTAAFFWTDFLRFIALNAIWAHCLGTKLCFYPVLYLLNTLNKTKLTRNGKIKKLIF